MLQEFQRPLNENERRCLSRLLDEVPRLARASGTLRWFALWVGILALCIFLFAEGLFRPDGPTVLCMALMPVVSLAGILSFYAAWMVISSYFRWRGGARRFACQGAPMIRAALEDGQALVCSVISDRVAVIEEYEDEVSAYIYDLGDGTSLYLRGQQYYPERDGSPWPARQFEIVRTRLSGHLVGLFTGGDPVPQIRTVPMAEMPASFVASNEPKTETILPGQPDEILMRLGHRAC